MRSAPLEGLQLEASRPPVATHAAQPSSGAGRPTIRTRTWIRPVIISIGEEIGHELIHPYVRRYWTAALGPSAVADLLRLGAAAKAGRRIRRPHGLSILLAEGLAAQRGSVVLVADRIPDVPPHHARRLPLFLQHELQSGIYR